VTVHMGTDHHTPSLGAAFFTNRRRWITAVALILATGAILRCFAITDDFWLDEIWSLSIAMKAGSAWEVFEMAHDNNHLLNTLFLYVLGPRDDWIPYRCLSLVCGLGTVVLGFFLGLRWGRVVGLVTGLLFSVSFLMIVYSTEARGYGPAAFFSLASFFVLELTLQRQTLARVLGFGVLVILGFSSHFTCAAFYIAALAWSATRYLQSQIGLRAAIVRWAGLHALPVVYLIILYLLVLRRLRIGGGPEWTLGQVVDELMAWSLGYPPGVVPILLPVLALLAALAWDSWELRKEGADEWVFHVFVILLAPIVTLVLLRPDYLFPRYFFVSLGFLFLVLARCIARIGKRGRAGAMVALSFVGLFCVGNAFHIGLFLKYGRGNYGDALQYMAENSQETVVTVASDHDFRNQMVVNYHKRFLRSGKEIVYYEQTSFPRQGVHWILTHSQALHPNAPSFLMLPTGHVYVLRRQFPYYGPSGWHWFVYEKKP